MSRDSIILAIFLSLFGRIQSVVHPGQGDSDCIESATSYSGNSVLVLSGISSLSKCLTWLN